MKRKNRKNNRKNKYSSWMKWIDYATNHELSEVRNLIKDCSFGVQFKYLYAFGIAKLIINQIRLDILVVENRKRLNELMDDYKTIY